MTESEFEELYSKAMKDDSEVPARLNDKLQKKLLFKTRYQKFTKAFPASVAACLVVGVVLTSVVYNNKDSFELKNDNKQDFKNSGTVVRMIEENSLTAEDVAVEEEKTPIKTEEKKKNSPKKETVKQEKEEQKPQTDIVYSYTKDESVVKPEISEEVQVHTENAVQKQALACVEDIQNDVSAYAGNGRSVKAITLIDYLGNDNELINSISQNIKKQIENDNEREYYKDFSLINGNEDYYINENGELIVIFETGQIASEDYGAISFNVGIINAVEEEK